MEVDRGERYMLQEKLCLSIMIMYRLVVILERVAFDQLVSLSPRRSEY